MFRPLVTLIILNYLVACGTEEILDSRTEPSEDVEEEAYSILGGVKLGKENPGINNAVAILKDGQFHCSGALLADNLVVTAAHCIQNIKVSSLKVVFAASTATKKAKKAKVLKTRTYVPSKPEDVVVFDLGWIKIEKIDHGYKPIPLLADLNLLRKAKDAVLVGYGVNEKDKNGVRRTIVAKVNVFKSPQMPGLFSLTSPKNKGACYGDSGGPSYVKIKKKWYLAGTVSGLDPFLAPKKLSCNGGFSFHTAAGVYRDWIAATSRVKFESYPASRKVQQMPLTKAAERPANFAEWCASSNYLDPTWLAGHRIFQLVAQSKKKIITCTVAKANLSKITEFELRDVPLTEYGPILELVNLDFLFLHNGKIHSLAGLEKLKKLTFLILNRQRLTDLSPLAKMRNLESIEFMYNRITDLAPIAKLPKLTMVVATNNLLTDVAPLKVAKNLAILDVQNNQVSDLSPLKGLKNINELYVAGTNPIAKARNRTSANCPKNAKSDIMRELCRSKDDAELFIIEP